MQEEKTFIDFLMALFGWPECKIENEYSFTLPLGEWEWFFQISFLCLDRLGIKKLEKPLISI